MRKFVCIPGLLGLLLFSIACDNPTGPQARMNEERVNWPSLCDSPWPILGSDPQYTFRSPYVGPSKCDTLRIYDNKSGYFLIGPLIGTNDAIYLFSSFDTVFFKEKKYRGAVVKKLSSHGTLEWQTLVSSGDASILTEPILLSPENLFILSTDGSYAKVGIDGELEYSYVNFFAKGASWGLNCDREGNLYHLPDEYRIISFQPEGITCWERVGRWYAGPISPDGEQIYAVKVAGQGWDFRDTLLALRSSDGEIMWKYPGPNGSMLSVNNDGDIFTCTLDSTIICLNSKGEVKWTKKIIIDGVGLTLFNNITIGPDGEIVVFLSCNGPDYVMSLDRGGQIRWTLPLASIEPSAAYGECWAVIDKNGNLYSSKLGTVFSLDKFGNIRWKIKMWDPKTGIHSDWLRINSRGEIIYSVSLPYKNLVYKIG